MGECPVSCFSSMMPDLVIARILSYVPTADLGSFQVADGGRDLLPHSGWPERFQRERTKWPVMLRPTPATARPSEAAEEPSQCRTVSTSTMREKTEETSCTDGSGILRSFDSAGDARQRYRDDVLLGRAWATATFRRHYLREGHSDGITCFAASPQASQTFSAAPVGLTGLLVSGGFDKSLVLWDLASRTRRASCAGHADTVTGVKFPTSESFFSVSFDGRLVAWALDCSPSALTPLASVTAHADRILAMDTDPQGQLVVTAGRDAVIKAHDARSMRVAQQFSSTAAYPGAHAECYYSMQLKDHLVLCGNHSGKVEIWDRRMQTVAPLAVLGVHSRPVMALLLEGDCLFTGCKGGTISILSGCRAMTGCQDTSVARLLGHRTGVRSLALAQRGSLLLSSSNDHTIRLWDLSRVVSHKPDLTPYSEETPEGSTVDLKDFHVIKSHTAQVPQIGVAGRTLVSASIDKSLAIHDFSV